VSQTPDFTIANAAGSTVRADLNTVLRAILTLNAGATAPTTTWPRMLWLDENNGRLKMRNAADTAWQTLAVNPDSMGLVGGSSVDGHFTLNAGSLLLGIAATGYALDASVDDAGDRVTLCPRTGAVMQPTKGLHVHRANGNVEVGPPAGTEPSSKLAVHGAIESTADGFKFPDGSVQLVAAKSRTWSADTQAALVFSNTASWQTSAALSLTLTPASAQSAFRISASVAGYCGSRGYWRVVRVGQSAGVGLPADGASTLGAHGLLHASAGDPAPMVREAVTLLDEPATTAAVTYRLEFRVNSSSHALHLNRSKPYSLDTAQSVTGITVEEIPGGLE